MGSIEFANGRFFWDSSGGAETLDGAGMTVGETFFGGTDSEVMIGGSGADTLVGGTGAETLTGGAGPDEFFIGVGPNNAGVKYVITDFTSADALFVGGGAFTAAAIAAATGNSFTLSNGATVTITNVLVSAIASNIKVEQDGGLVSSGPSPTVFSAGGDTLFGGAGSGGVLLTAAGDTLFGGATSAETVIGNSVSDTINSTGSFALLTAAGDTLAGFAGAETITGNSVSGLSINSTGSFTLLTAAGDTLEGTAGAETITGSAGSVTLFGATNGETLLGGANTHTITGGAGNDTLTAGAGNDTLKGGAGNDYLDGGIGTDVAVYSGPRASYQVTTLAGGAIQIVDERAGSPDGTDTVSNVEEFQFADGLFAFSVPQVTDTTTPGEKVAHSTTLAVGTVTPGLPGDTLTLTELTGPAGAVTLSNGVVSFAAPANASGNVSFSYQISDQRGDVSAVISDTLAVDPGPSVTDTTTAGEKVAHGTAVAVATVTPGLPGDTLTLTELTGPAGAVTLSNGVVSFAAPANASGNVAFSYKITDQLGDVSAVISDTLAVETTPPDLTPIADQTDEATGPNGAVATFAATATDLVDGTDPVVFTEETTVVHSGETFSLGTHTITASATNAAGNTASEQFTITVQDTTPPTLTPLLFQAVDATGPNGAAVTFAATATDLVDGADPVVFMQGTQVVHSGDLFSLGTHTITASATDAAGNTSSEQFKIDVVDPTPIAANDTYSVNLGQVLHLPGPGVLANDTDVAGAPLSAVLQSGTNNGLLTLNPDGSLIYQPFFTGPTIFSYQASNGTSTSNPATVTINVNEGSDTFDSSQVSANTTVVLTASGGTAISTAFGRKTLTGVNNVITGPGNDTVVGNNNGDILYGGSGNNTVTGGSGNDVLISGAGNDRLTGGGGNNTFVFRPGLGQDTVVDFKVGTAANHDTLDLRGLGFTSVADVLRQTDGGPNAVIHVGTESITLQSVDKNTLAAHPFAVMTG